jgi:hypothetical protein
MYHTTVSYVLHDEYHDFQNYNTNKETRKLKPLDSLLIFFLTRADVMCTVQNLDFDHNITDNNNTIIHNKILNSIQSD